MVVVAVPAGEGSFGGWGVAKLGDLPVVTGCPGEKKAPSGAGAEVCARTCRAPF